MGLFGLALVVFLGYSAYRVFFEDDAERRKAYIKGVLSYAVTAGLLVAAFRSGLPWLMFVILAGYVAVRATAAYRKAKGGTTPGASSASRPKRMTRSEALDVLGLPEGATDAEINDRYRTLMRKMHPDQGGSPYLATQLNQAKRVLLER